MSETKENNAFRRHAGILSCCAGLCGCGAAGSSGGQILLRALAARSVLRVARPLKRYIQANVETMIAKEIIGGNHVPGDTLTVDAENGKLVLR